MLNILDKIINQKKLEVKNLLKKDFLRKVKPKTNSNSFKNSLSQNGLSVIAEIKRQSPSKGKLSEIPTPKDLASRYIKGRANAISVLTDKKYFAGSLNDLIEVKNNPAPILRKDFIIDPIQINESVLIGASAILLIVAVLKKKLKKMLDYAKKMNIETLVEVHNKSELKVALDAGAEIIGINNRNLKTFQVDISNSLNLVKEIPNNIIKVSESGINSPEIAQKLHKAGFDAILVGETLVCSKNPSDTIRKMRDIK